MAIQESQFGAGFANVPQNYLYDWARRTNNLGNMANYYVEDRLDPTTGAILFRIRDIADLAANPSNDPGAPMGYNPAPSDPLVTAEYLAAQ